MSSYTHPGPACRTAAAALLEVLMAPEQKRAELLKAALEKAAVAFEALSRQWHGS